MISENGADEKSYFFICVSAQAMAGLPWTYARLA
jgi:hypothetical protein